MRNAEPVDGWKRLVQPKPQDPQVDTFRYDWMCKLIVAHRIDAHDTLHRIVFRPIMLYALITALSDVDGDRVIEQHGVALLVPIRACIPEDLIRVRRRNGTRRS